MENENRCDTEQLNQPIVTGINKSKIFPGFPGKKPLCVDHFLTDPGQPSSNQRTEFILKHHISDMDGYEVDIYLK